VGRFIQPHLGAQLLELLGGREVAQAEQGGVAGDQGGETEHDQTHPEERRHHPRDPFQQEHP
jgi:hypothetical protein